MPCALLGDRASGKTTFLGLLYSAQVLTQRLYPKFIISLRSLAGGSLIMLPSGIEDFAHPALARYSLAAQTSPSLSPAGQRK